MNGEPHTSADIDGQLEVARQVGLSHNHEAMLFHYTDAAALVGIIENRELWATESNFLNDSSEIGFASGVLISRLKERIAGGASLNDKRRAESAIELLEREYVDPNTPDRLDQERVFVSSFSRSDNSLTLWRAYGGRNGFAIGFDQSRLCDWIGQEPPSGDSDSESLDENETRRALTANFQLEAQFCHVAYGAVHVDAILDSVMDLPYEAEASFALEAKLREILKRLASIKHDAFADEREARLLVRSTGDFAADPSIRVSAMGALAAYRKVAFPRDAIRSITMAPGANESQTRHAITSLLRDEGRGEWSHVDIRECRIPFVW